MGKGSVPLFNPNHLLFFLKLDPIQDGFWVFIVCGEKKTVTPNLRPRAETGLVREVKGK